MPGPQLDPVMSQFGECEYYFGNISWNSVYGGRSSFAVSTHNSQWHSVRKSMLGKFVSYISGNLPKDTPLALSVRPSKDLQAAECGPGAVLGTDCCHGTCLQPPASGAAPHGQQQLLDDPTAAPVSNGTCPSACAGDAAASISNEKQHAKAVASTNTSSSHSHVNGCIPQSADLVAAGIATTTQQPTTFGSECAATVLSDSGRASRRNPLCEDIGQLQEQQPCPVLESSQQHFLPPRPAVSQLPLHLLQPAADSPPPFVANQQADAPEQQQVLQQTFWQGSNWSFGWHTEQNQRKSMEDRFQAIDLTGHAALPGADRAGFFAVYDGHAGHEAAEYLASHLLSYVLEAGPEALAVTPLQVLGDAVQQAEQELVANYVAGQGGCAAGSTLCAVLLVNDKLHVAHVGDSRAVLGRGAEPNQLTRDHKPICRVEAARIADDDPNADISSDGYMYGELAVARAIGSAHLKRDPSKRALIPTPDLTSVQLQAEDDFVVLATDGLWDKVENQEAVALTRRSLSSSRDATTAARALVERAQRRDSSDNISVIMLLLHGRAIALPKSNSRLFRRTTLSALGGGAGGGPDSPRSCSTACCSGASTPASGATPRSSTPIGGASTTAAPQHVPRPLLPPSGLATVSSNGLL